MADNMCGPSNGAKNLVSHVDRDRSMYQDRFTSNAQAGGSVSFRSNTPFGQGAEAGFNDFQQANLAPDLAVNHMPLVADRAFTPPVNHVAHAPPMNARPAGFAPSPMGKAVEKGWVNEFSTMTLGPDVAHSQTAQPNHIAPVHNPWAPSPMGLQSQQRQFYMAPSPAFAPMMGNAPAVSAPQFAGPATQGGQMDLEAFNRAFGDYDEMLFEQDIAAWKGGDQTTSDQEFKEAETEWMAKHGPTAELQQQKPGQPSLEEMNTINQDLEKLADEIERQHEASEPAVAPTPQETEALRKRLEDEQLAKAAVDIVNSVSNNATEKFQNSQFLELMRRIANREVVVNGENFVDAETGEGLVTAQHDATGNDGDHQLKSETIPRADS